jgi:glycerol-3-phosphate acyltransferase PlsY
MMLAAAVAAAYLLGSIPTSYLAGRLGAGIDLREQGSRNLGATNVWRVLGPRYAIPVGLFDVAKGTVSAMVLGPLAGSAPWIPLLTGGAAVAGHVFPVFLRFRGGKGVATAAGVLLGIAPLAVGLVAAVWALVVLASGYVSLGSLSGAVLFPVAARLLYPRNTWIVTAGVVLALFVVFTHRANIRRLMSGTESRFGRRKREA